MLHVVQSFGDELPAACKSTCQEAWAVFDNFLSSNGSDYQTAEKTTRVLRHGISLFGTAVLPIAPGILSRMTAAFEMTGFPCYIWIAGKVIGRFGNEEDPTLRDAFLQTYERTTTKVVNLLRQKTPGEIPDGMMKPIIDKV
jgi:transportin-3